MVTVVKHLFVYKKGYTISLGFDFSFPYIVYVSTVRQEKTCCPKSDRVRLKYTCIGLECYKYLEIFLAVLLTLCRHCSK